MKNRENLVVSRALYAAVASLSVLMPANAEETKAVFRVLDADTVAVGSTRIRLNGVDAPETDQVCLDAQRRPWNCGLVAKAKLEEFAQVSWSCKLLEKDLYGRYIGACRVNDKDVSRWLVRNGWALAFRRYSTEYVADEDFARSQKLGLWSGAFIAPWEWRRRGRSTDVLGAFEVPVGAQRELISPKLVSAPPIPTCNIKATIRKGACIYHIPGGQLYGRVNMADTKTRRWYCDEIEAEAAGCRKSRR